MDYHLLTFVEVAEKLNFTRAAESLHITQSAVTLSIKSLEKKYNTKFLDRTNKYVRLTKAGEVLYHHAKKILTEYERLEGLIDNIANEATGSLFIGSSYTFGEYLLPTYVHRFMQENTLVNPKISIENSECVLKKVLNGQLDIGIIDGKVTKHPNLEIIPFEKDEMVIIVSPKHPLSRSKFVDLEDLFPETWVIREEGSGTRQIIDALFQKHAFTPLTIRSFGSTQIIKESVEANLGISFVSTFSIQKELYMKTLHPIYLKNEKIMRNFSYVIPKIDYRPRTVDLFIQTLSNHSIIKEKAH